MGTSSNTQDAKELESVSKFQACLDLNSKSTPRNHQPFKVSTADTCLQVVILQNNWYGL